MKNPNPHIPQPELERLLGTRPIQSYRNWRYWDTVGPLPVGGRLRKRQMKHCPACGGSRSECCEQEVTAFIVEEVCHDECVQCGERYLSEEAVCTVCRHGYIVHDQHRCPCGLRYADSGEFEVYHEDVYPTDAQAKVAR